MSVKCVPPQTPLLYSETGVCRGIPIFLIFAPKHRLWVLVRTASARRFLRVPTIYALSKNKKNMKNILTATKNFLYIAWTSFRNVAIPTTWQHEFVAFHLFNFTSAYYLFSLYVPDCQFSIFTPRYLRVGLLTIFQYLFTKTLSVILSVFCQVSFTIKTILYKYL